MTLAQTLLDQRLLTPPDLARAEAMAARDNRTLDRAILALGLVEEAQLLDALGQSQGIARYNSNGEIPLNTSLLERYGLTWFKSQRLLPLSTTNGKLPLLTDDPLNAQKLKEAAFFIGVEVSPVALTSAELDTLFASLDTAPQDTPTDATLIEDAPGATVEVSWTVASDSADQRIS